MPRTAQALAHLGRTLTLVSWWCFKGARLQDQLLAMLRSQLIAIMSGAVFLFIGLAACSLAVVRRRRGMRLFVWLGIWSAMYGARLLVESPAVAAALPDWLQIYVPYLKTAINYLLVPVVAMAWLELSVDKMRPFLYAVVFMSLAIGVAGIGFFVITGSDDKLLLYNNLVAATALVVLVIIVAIPGLSRRFLVLPNRAVMVVGTLVFALEALYFNLSQVLHYQTWRITGSLGLAILLLSFGYVAVQIAMASERRLLSIENELAIAREIQASILPRDSPELNNLRVAAAYRPMTAVAGDFYEFIPVDKHHIGFLLADVTGHGVPAAFIAAMIKVAMQSVVPCAHDPREVLRGLNRVLFAQLSSQLVSAAYLWLDTENRIALYSAAGHPPLLHCREGKLERIESNGLLLGVLPNADYPLVDLPVLPGDRFLLYTDGVIEPENALGHPFGEHRLEQVVHNNQSRPPSELLDQLLSEIRQWQPASMAQKDDITLIAIDVV
jgi:sigma-B regulation protein RsbU (phosphoserine phosphatase)